MLKTSRHFCRTSTGMPGDFEVSFYSVIRGFHVYKAIWTATIGEEPSTSREYGNPADQYAVAVQKSGTTTVGHIPREISKTSWYFIGHDGEIRCRVTGRRQRSILLKGGLEIPCIYTFKRKRSWWIN